MKSFRAKRRPGNRPPSTDESTRIVAAKEGPCVACLVWVAQGNMNWADTVYGCDYNHAKSGNIRRGHGDGYALCVHHHRGHPMRGLTSRETRRIYGPSLMDGSRLFHETYGSDDDLIAMQTRVIQETA